MSTTLATKKTPVDKAMSLLFAGRESPYTMLKSAMRYPVPVQDGDVQEVFAALDEMVTTKPSRVVDLVVALAALVDVEKTPSELLEWMCPAGERPKQRPSEAQCGTVDGHIAHVEGGQEPCRPCQAAFDRAVRPVKKRSGPAECGTPAGWQRHKRAKEDPCDPCKDAMRAYWKGHYDRNYKPVRPERSTKLIGCPSRAGYEWHVRHGEEPCAGCIAERRKYFAEKARNRYKKKPVKVKPCPTPAARQRHRRKREKCETCWPATVPQPGWYAEVGVPRPEAVTHPRAGQAADCAPAVVLATGDALIDLLTAA